MSGRVAVIAGASGLVGGYALRALLESEQLERVVALSRRPLDDATLSKLSLRDDATAFSKLTQSVVDFQDASSLVHAVPKDVEDAYCALGTTMKNAGSRAAFLKVDRDAVLNFARATRTCGARRFILVSAIGADPRAMSFYSRVKGEVEQALATMGWDTVHVLRPSILDGPRTERRPLEHASLVLGRRLAFLLGNMAPIHADTVGRAMVQLALGPERGFLVHASKDLARRFT